MNEQNEKRKFTINILEDSSRFHIDKKRFKGVEKKAC